jgi:hypothetical protein
MRKRSASIVPGAKPRPSGGVERWLDGGETGRRGAVAMAVGACDGELAGAPHEEQKRAVSGTSAAQLGHRNIRRIVSQVVCVAQAPSPVPGCAAPSAST